MLQRLSIHNLALIRDLEMEFGPMLNVLSGETGAGKSIIVDSLMLLIGARYDKTLLKYGESSGFVEGVFDIDDVSPLDNAGIDAEDGLVIVTRKFYKDGKNEIRVNGRQVTTATLRELMSYYVDIYGQNEYYSLLKTSEQRKILDTYVFVSNDVPLKEHRELYDEYSSLCRELKRLGNAEERAQRIDILKYQIEEIKKAAVKEGEEEKLLERRHLLMASERIKTALGDCYNALDGEGVSEAIRALAAITSFGDNYAELSERLRSVSIELDDIADCIKDELDGMDSFESELDALSARLDKIRALKSKYGNYAAMQKFVEKAESELSALENGEESYIKLSDKLEKIKERLLSSCKTLSEMRKRGAEKMQARVLEELSDLGMAKSKFEVVFSDIDEKDMISEVTATGFDEFEFYLSPNAGMPPMPLAKIISGGELSRFMLAIKLVAGAGGTLGTMIFDEIDTGISGAMGFAVAKKLCALSRHKQVLCVTHLAQIAAMADSHFYIDKYDDELGTVTRVTALDRSGRIGEVSRLSGTKGISDSSDKNAEEFIMSCDRIKESMK